MTSYLRRKRVLTWDTNVGPPQRRWQVDCAHWLIPQFHGILSRSRDLLHPTVAAVRPKLRPANSAKFVLLWLLMGWVSVVQADLVAHYTFDDGSAKDVSGNGHHGAVYGATLTEDSSGKVEGAYYFDQKSERIRVGHSSDFDMSDELTLSACVKSSKIKRFNQDIIAKNGNGGSFSLSLGETRGNKKRRYQFCFLIGLEKDGAKGVRNICSDKHYDSDRWYHVVGVYEYGDATIYVNGEDENSKPFKKKKNKDETPLIKNNEKVLWIGNHGKAEPFFGAIDDVRIYDHALSGSEIDEIACGSSSTTGGDDEPNQPPPINRPPVLKDPIPTLGAIVQEPNNLILKWTGTDPENAPLTFNVWGGETWPFTTLCENKSSPTCPVPYPFNPGKPYFWQVEASDGQNTTKETWGFATQGNNPPFEPRNPQPEDGKESVKYSSNVELKWLWENGGQPDPDGDEVTCNVYLSDVKSRLINLSSIEPDCPNVSSTKATCPVVVDPDKTYYWRVVAKDEHDLSTKGLFWQFETQSFESAFKVNYSNGVAPFTVKFTDTSVGDIKTWTWDFGVEKSDSTENETSTEQHPSFTFEKPDIYPVKLTVKDQDGQKRTAEMDITVKELELVPLTVRPGADTMNLDWSAESINTYIPDPTNTIIKFWRDLEGTENWQLVDTQEYMDSLMSANQYFDKNAIEPKMEEDQNYCYYFKVLMVKDGDTNLLTQSEIACETFGAVRIFINDVPSAAPGQNVYIPVKISNAQGLGISGGNLRLAFDKSVFVVGENPNDDLKIVQEVLKDYNYDVSVKKSSQDNDKGRIVDFVIKNQKPLKIEALPEIIVNGGSEFFMITGKVREDVANGTRTQFFWEANGSSMGNAQFQNITLSFGNADFRVKKAHRTRDSKLQLLVDGYFTVDAKGRLGDPNLSTSVTPVDGMLILGHITNKTAYSFSNKQFAAADVNGNGKIDANDATRIFYYSNTGKWPSLSSGDSQSAQDDAPMVIKLGDISGESGTEVETTLNVENLSNFTGGEFIISYDPAVVVGINSVDPTIFTNEFIMLFNDNGEGKIRIAMASPEPINGNGELATVKLRLKSKTTLRKRLRDGAAVGKRSANLVLAQTQFYDPVGRNFVTSKLQRTVERKNAEVVRTDVVEEVNGDDTSTGTGDNLPPKDIVSMPKVRGQILDKAGDPIVGVTIQVGDQTVITDETSYWEIVEIAEGDYTITASKAGYTFVPQTITVANENLIINLKEVVDTNNAGDVDTGSVMNVYTASGFVLDQDAKPKAGALVRVGNKTATTDDTGYWVVLGLEAGEHMVTPFQDNHAIALSETCVVDSQHKCKLTFIEESVGEYRTSGTIRDELGNPIEDIAVQVGEIITVTDAAGYWEIDNLAEGEYTVEIGAEYYESPPRRIEIGNGQNAVVNLKLESLLNVKVTAVPRVAKQGENVTYTITVTNKGDETATGVVLSDVLPDGTDLVAFHALDGGNCSAEMLSCTLPDLTPGATAMVELIIANTQAKKLQNTATVIANEYPNNVQVTWTEVMPYLFVSVTDTPDPVSMLSEVHYTLDVELSHYAPSAATGVKLVMTLPSGVTLESINTDYGMCDTSTLPTVTCELIDLSIESAESISHIIVDMDVKLQDGGLLLLTAEAKVTANEYPAHTDRERTKIFIPEDVEVDIAFVIDVTGSMQEEINGVIKALKGFIAEIDPNDAPLVALVVFTDDVKVKAFTSDLDALLKAVENLKAAGGGTCPEASADALLIAIPHTKPDGNILFATDASPYENADIDKIVELLRGKSIRFNAMITGDCTQPDSWNEIAE
jgi:uncharacterized repeat protein (TIGR01451 family)